MVTSWCGAVAMLFILGACDRSAMPAQLKTIAVDMPLGIVIDRLGKGPLESEQLGDAELMIGGYRRDSFETAAGQPFIVWYRKVRGTPRDPVSRATDTPLLFGSSGRLLAVGWSDVADALRDQKLSASGIPGFEAQ